MLSLKAFLGMYIEIVRDTCDAIWECLKMVCMSARDKNNWMGTADDFYEMINFPDCI